MRCSNGNHELKSMYWIYPDKRRKRICSDCYYRMHPYDREDFIQVNTDVKDEEETLFEWAQEELILRLGL